MNDGQNTMGMISAVCGILAILGHGCCCLPIISYIAPFLVIILEMAAIITGVMARQQAAAQGGTDGLAMVGILSGSLAVLMSIGYVLLFGAAIFAYIAGIVAMVVLGQ